MKSIMIFLLHQQDFGVKFCSTQKCVTCDKMDVTSYSALKGGAICQNSLLQPCVVYFLRKRLFKIFSLKRTANFFHLRAAITLVQKVPHSIIPHFLNHQIESFHMVIPWICVVISRSQVICPKAKVAVFGIFD